jgi:hypothetical protein
MLDWIKEPHRLYRNQARASYTAYRAPAAWAVTMTKGKQTSSRKSAMANSYTKQLADWVRQRSEPRRYEANRAAFLGVKEDVRSALEQGWPVKTIWAHLVAQKRIGIGYDMFLIYVKRHVRPAEENAATSTNSKSGRPPGPGHPAANQGREGRPTAREPSVLDGEDRLPGFTFNAAPNREELI